MKDIIEQRDFGPALIVGADMTQRAKTLNKLGEDAYHANNIEASIEYYRQAIELDPNFGQAYSNLGLSHMKLNHSAEAIWASRKAIELASGPTAATVRASSYYNIAKQYESEGQWSDAKVNYELAQQNKKNQVYTKAIQRMEEKLNTEH
jgi:tetratricopeptide (TPR) repeat protein